MTRPIQVYIGYDDRQPIASQVLTHSIWRTASKPISVTRLVLSQLPITRRGLTEFTFSRFLVPYLSDFEGYSVFLDADMLCRADMAELLIYPLAFPTVPVFVVMHEKLFERPSVMVFNNALCKALTPEYVDNKDNNLYSLKWADSVGALPKEWNHLVGYDASNPNAKIVHFTQGIPCWPETEDCEFSEEWSAAYDNSRSSVSFEDLMGRSVHVPFVKRMEDVALNNA